jgi:hypothetical protein
MDVHKEAIAVAILNSTGKLVMECVIETKAVTILDFLKGSREEAGLDPRAEPQSQSQKLVQGRCHGGLRQGRPV